MTMAHVQLSTSGPQNLRGNIQPARQISGSNFDFGLFVSLGFSVGRADSLCSVLLALDRQGSVCIARL